MPWIEVRASEGREQVSDPPGPGRSRPEAQAAAQSEQARLLGQLRAQDNELRLARLEVEKGRCGGAGLGCRARGCRMGG